MPPDPPAPADFARFDVAYVARELARRRRKGECHWHVFVDAQGRWRIAAIPKADIVDIPHDLGIQCEQ